MFALSSLRRTARFVLLPASLLGLLAVAPARAAALDELPVLKSQGGVLDVLVVARAEKITTLGALKPTGWVYDICPRPSDGSDACPPRPPAPLCSAAPGWPCSRATR